MSFFKRGGISVVALCFVFALSSVASAASITHQLFVNPIQVSADDGTMTSNPTMELFEAATDKIWEQAGIDIVFLPWKTWNSSASLTISATSELLLAGNAILSSMIPKSTQA